MNNVERARQSVRRKWIGKEADEDMVAMLAERFKIHPIVARVLTARNCASIESAERFLLANRSELINPSYMHDMDLAVTRIRQAIAHQEHIALVGDYDVDGVCATAILVRSLRTLGASVDWLIPSRFTDGYGLNKTIVERAAANSATLIITCDNGIAAYEAATRAKELGIDLLITDHHKIGEIPPAYAIVHPAFPNSMYGFPDLCGAGVAFKLSQAILGRFPEELLDMVALGTIADQVPLVGENRVLVREGLKVINQNESCLGIKALLNAAGVDRKRVTSTNLAFQVAPRINAVGRLAEADLAVELLLTDDATRAITLAEKLNSYNNKRKAIQDEVENEALKQIEANPEWLERRALVVSGQNWHEGLIGIVSGRLTERFHKSTLCISIDAGKAKGSGRSIPNFDLFRAVAEMQQGNSVLERWGGHKSAVGFSLHSKRIDELRDGFVESVERNWVESDELSPHILCDAPLEISQLSYELVDQLAMLEPFGQGNPEPVFFIRDARIESVQTLGVERRHLKVWVKGDESTAYPVLAFGHGEALRTWRTADKRHLLVKIGDNVWKGRRTLQMQLVDAK